MSASTGDGWHNPLTFVADDVALYLAEARAVDSAEAALRLPLARALELSVRLSHRSQVQAEMLRRS